LSRIAAWIAATIAATDRNAAKIMCRHWGPDASLSIAAKGRISVNRPSTSVKPAGAFIHAFAVTTNSPEAVPLTSTAAPAQKCARGGTRSQP
jgi:hypothetical protein